MDQNQKLFSDDELKDILDKDLLELLGAKNMSDEDMATMYEKMAMTVQDRVMLRIYDALSNEERGEFATIVDSGDVSKTHDFLLGKDINVPKLLVQEAVLYKLEIMSLLKMGKEESANTDDAVTE